MPFRGRRPSHGTLSLAPVGRLTTGCGVSPPLLPALLLGAKRLGWVPPVGLSAGTAHRFLRAAAQAGTDLSLRDCALVQLLLRTGLRIDEAVSLRVQDVAAYERSGRVRLRGVGQRCPLSAEARRAIRAYLDAQGHPKGSEPLFVSHEGHALSVRSAQAAVLEIGHGAKLERVTPQLLRRTFAVNYLKENPGKLPQLATLLQCERAAKAAHEALTHLLSRRKVAATTDAGVREALEMDLGDFEDAVCVAAALEARCDFIVTRNVRHLRGAKVPALLPEAALSALAELLKGPTSQ